MATLSDQEIIELFEKDKEAGINAMFTQYYNYLCHAVYKILNDQVQVEDVVQEVFYEFWKKKEDITINISLKAYLRRSSVNKALNFIRDRKIKFDDEEKIDEVKFSDKTNAQSSMEYLELEEYVTKAIDSLPEKCRIIFSMSRFEELTYKEIASKLEISTKTVENQISKALKLLRAQIKPYVKKMENKI